ncbi:MAG: S24 family peptidase, partial [Pseudomonadota bacterium]
LAQLTGLSRTSIQNCEAGKQPRARSLLALSQALSVSLDWLMTGQAGPADPEWTIETERPAGSRPVPTEASLTFAVDQVPPLPPGEIPQADLFTLVPLAEAHLSAGGGSWVPSERAQKFLAFRRDWLKAYASSPQNVVLLLVQGQSMAPTLVDGDLVMLDVGRRQPLNSGGIYAIGHEDTISIKRLEILLGSRNIRVISDNRNEYPPYVVDLSELRILGRIIWYARELIR